MQLEDWGIWEKADIKDMEGKKITGLSLYGEEGPLFICSDGTQFLLTHLQECCENVDLEDANAAESFWLALNEGKEVTIISADERSNNEESEYESETWTFYNFDTDQGYLNLRFYGSSNGYYSEGVSVMKRVVQ